MDYNLTEKEKEEFNTLAKDLEEAGFEEITIGMYSVHWSALTNYDETLQELLNEVNSIHFANAGAESRVISKLIDLIEEVL